MNRDITARRGPSLARLALSLVLGAAVVVAGRRAAAQAVPTGTDTLRLAVAVPLALDSNPMLRAARSGAIAAAERVGPAGTLPDPRLELALMNRMASDFGSTMDPMTMNQLQVTQMLPWPGKLGNARRGCTARLGRGRRRSRRPGPDAQGGGADGVRRGGVRRPGV